MSNSFTSLRHELIQLSEPVRDYLRKIQYKPPEGSNVSVKSMLESLLPTKNSTPNSNSSENEFFEEVKDFSLCCALLVSCEGSKCGLISWIPPKLSILAKAAFQELSKVLSDCLDVKHPKRIGELGLDLTLLSNEERLVVELMIQVLPLLKESIKTSSIDGSDDGDDILAASARTPVAYAVVAAYQLRWFVTQVDYPHMGKLCFLVIPCALTALDHWSPEVKFIMSDATIHDTHRETSERKTRNLLLFHKYAQWKVSHIPGQGMISFIHLAKNVNPSELSWYEDVILDACCQNIASSDDIWHLVVEMSVLLVTCTQQSNPRSPWYERILNEMLGHLERQPKNKDRRIAWLELVEPLLNAVGLLLLAHFRSIFPLFFKWMHADDDQTVLLVLKRTQTVMKLTWIRNTPYVERLVDELVVLFKEAALRRAREDIRTHVLQILVLLQKCKGLQFEAAWEKHRDDPNLTTLASFFSERYIVPVVE